jgi:hypothetical protein
MRFRYSSYEVDASPTVPGGVLYRPEVNVSIIGPRGSEIVQALVDTGSDETVFPTSLADAIGVQLNRNSTGRASAVGGHAVELVPGDIAIQISNNDESYRWRTTVAFLEVDLPEDEVALLGYAGFLEYFRATFDRRDRRRQLGVR